MRLEWGYGKGMGARLVLLRRLDRTRARKEARTVLITLGACSAVRHLRTRYKRGVLGDLIRTAGTLVALPPAAVRLGRGAVRRGSA